MLHALDVLAEGDRALIVLRFKNGLEYDELATAFGLREGTVRMRVSRALARMRHVLEGDERTMPPAGTPPPPPRAPAAAPMAVRLRSAQIPSPMIRAPEPRGSLGAPPPISWWSRLKEWAGFGGSAEPEVPAAPPSRPLGSLGLALAACEPTAPSENLAERLGALIERLPTG